MNILTFIFISVPIGGFFEYQGIGYKINNTYAYTGYEKINLLISQRFSSAYFRADFVYVNYQGKTTYDISDFFPDSLKIPGLSMSYKYESAFYLRNGFFRLSGGPVSIQIGKQQIGWGTGYAFNPTNLFQVKSILDPSYELIGVDAIKGDITFFSLWGIETLYLPGESSNQSSWGGKIRGDIFNGTDFSVGYLDYLKNSIDSVSLLSITERRRVITGDFSGEILGIGIHGEAIYNKDNKIAVMLLGGNYTFGDGLTSLLIEYLWNGEGKEGSYNLSDWLNYLSGFNLSMGKNELFFNIQRTLELTNIYLSGIVNIIDRSGILIPRIEYSINDNTSLIFSPNIVFGKEGKEYSSIPDGLFLRIRISF